MGPELQYTGEKPADPLTLWVYTGADATFELYEDDGVSYAYEKGAFATIPLRWDEKAGALTIGARSGSYPGDAKARASCGSSSCRRTPRSGTRRRPATARVGPRTTAARSW